MTIETNVSEIVNVSIKLGSERFADWYSIRAFDMNGFSPIELFISEGGREVKMKMTKSAAKDLWKVLGNVLNLNGKEVN